MDTVQNIRRLVRDVPDFPKPGIVFKDITPVLQDGSAFREMLDIFANHFRAHNIDKIVGIESRGFLFAAPLAYAMEKGVVIVRKPGKLPYKTISETYSLEYGTDTLEIHADAVKPGERVIVMDDLLATGGTCMATINLLRKLGAQVVGCGFLIELAFLEGRKKLGDIPIFAPLSY